MWLWMAVGSALFLGFYDVAKKQSLSKNCVLMIQFITTALSTLFLIPFFSQGPLTDHLWLVFKGLLVAASWITGLYGIKYMPLTTASTIKASRPMFVVLFSILIFGERLNAYQWVGVVVVLLSMFLLSRSSKKEGIDFANDKGFLFMVASVFTGVASALVDKHILTWMEPLFVQSWCNLYIAVITGIVMLIQWKKGSPDYQKLRWDWFLLIIAVFITLSDFMYFNALHSEGALLAVVSLIRRCNVIVTFVCGAILFKEKNLKSKSLALAVLLIGMVFLVLGSK